MARLLARSLVAAGPRELGTKIMARRCDFTGKGVQTGNNVSHANNRSRRRYLPNMQKVSFHSEVLGKMLQVRACVAAVRTIEKRGGIDAYLLSTSVEKLGQKARVLKRRIHKASETKAAQTTAA